MLVESKKYYSLFRRKRQCGKKSCNPFSIFSMNMQQWYETSPPTWRQDNRHWKEASHIFYFTWLTVPERYSTTIKSSHAPSLHLFAPLLLLSCPLVTPLYFPIWSHSSRLLEWSHCAYFSMIHFSSKIRVWYLKFLFPEKEQKVSLKERKTDDDIMLKVSFLARAHRGGKAKEHTGWIRGEVCVLLFDVQATRLWSQLCWSSETPLESYIFLCWGEEASMLSILGDKKMSRWCSPVWRKILWLIERGRGLWALVGVPRGDNKTSENFPFSALYKYTPIHHPLSTLADLPLYLSLQTHLYLHHPHSHRWTSGGSLSHYRGRSSEGSPLPKHLAQSLLQPPQLLSHCARGLIDHNVFSSSHQRAPNCGWSQLSSVATVNGRVEEVIQP